MKIELFPLTINHLGTYMDWILNKDYRRFRVDAPPTLEEIRTRIEHGDFVPNATKGMFLFREKGGLPVGWVSYFRPDRQFDAFELGIRIASPDDRGKGFGGAAIHTLATYLFDHFDTPRIQVRVLEDNSQALAMIKKLGWKHEGIQRKACKLENGRFDVHIFGWLKSER